MDDMGHVVTMMFVTHCPNHELYTAFGCKPREKWTVGEVQELIDSHQNDRCATRRKQNILTPQEDIQKTEESSEHPVLTSAVQGVQSGNDKNL